MKKSYPIIAAVALVVAIILVQFLPGNRDGMVVSPHPIASKIGIQILKDGGNAVDAAVAVGLALGVVDQFHSGLGGGMFMLIRRADGRTAAIDAREVAPAAASARMYYQNYRYMKDASQTGSLSVAVPGALAGYEMALKEFGSKNLSEVIAPSEKVAREGFVLDDYYAGKLAGVANTLYKDKNSRHYFKKDGKPLSTGDLLIQPGLANAYAGIAENGTDYFYKGPIAEAIVKLMKTDGGIISAEDLLNYKPVNRKPVTGKFHGYDVLGMPPSSSGGIHVIQILGLMDLQRGKTKALQLVKAMQYAFYDRHRYLGDSDFVDVPINELVSEKYLGNLKKKIIEGIAPPHGVSARNLEGNHTAGFVVIDKHGNSVAATATINTTFGSKRTIPEFGIVLNNEMDDFVTNFEGSNTYGLTGNDSNKIQPRKRPLSSMSPTIVMSGNRPAMLVAAAGGPMIITSVAQTIYNVLGEKMNVGAAVAAPRLHHQWLPIEVFVEDHYPESEVKSLTDAGYVVSKPAWKANVQAVVRKRWTGNLEGASDPRANGAAAGY